MLRPGLVPERQEETPRWAHAQEEQAAVMALEGMLRGSQGVETGWDLAWEHGKGHQIGERTGNPPEFAGKSQESGLEHVNGAGPLPDQEERRRTSRAVL